MEHQGTGSDECLNQCFRKRQKILRGMHCRMPQEMLQRMPRTLDSIKNELLDMPLCYIKGDCVISYVNVV